MLNIKPIKFKNINKNSKNVGHMKDRATFVNEQHDFKIIIRFRLQTAKPVNFKIVNK